MNACVSSSSGMKKSDDLDEDPARVVQVIRRQLEDYAGSGQPHHKHTYIHTYIHTYRYTNTNIQIHVSGSQKADRIKDIFAEVDTDGQSLLRRHIHTYIHTYTHTCIHTYTHIHITKNNMHFARRERNNRKTRVYSRDACTTR
jgi:hypothetical protein